MRILAFILITVSSIQCMYGQGEKLWTSNKSSIQSRSSIPTSNSLIYDLDKIALKGKLKRTTSTSPQIIEIPLANGEIKQFKITPNRTMSAGLAAKYPAIQTFEAKSVDGTTHGKVDLTPAGFHGMLFTSEGTMFIDPLNKDNSITHKVYYKKDFEAYNKVGLTDDQLLNKSESKSSRIDLSSKKTSQARSNGTELRTYRLAITTTGEYTNFHGGTVSGALAAIVTTINRVNGIYEKELAISFTLIDNTDLLIYTNPTTDPYTNDTGSTYINEVQQNIDDIIGNANYDIGHGFSTGGGGLAGPGPCQTGLKANGITGTSSPVGDPYDVDYVAHEIGHQFGANHTFNSIVGSCGDNNRSNSTAYEPGSGSTILAYAGICTPQNIQDNSDPYFHTASYDEILNYSVNGPGNSCATITATGNNPPLVEAGTGGFSIPINTPFTLAGTGTDPDGDALTFNWEQFDLGPEGNPNSPSGNAPIFRSFSPQPEPTRTFPQISDILNNTQTLGEILPSYSRSLTFRLTARDNKSGGGGVNHDQLTFDVTDQAGPFVINSFNTTSTIRAQSNVEILWDVANTDALPINCQNVNILMSEDGGTTFNHILKSNTPNDGVENVLIPNIVSSQVRFKIEAVGNIFFDINNANINVEAPVVADYYIEIEAATLEVCNTTASDISIEVGSILNFSKEVTLSVSGLEDGLIASFSTNPVTPGNFTGLSISNPSQTANGNYPLTITATDGTNSKVEYLAATVFDGIVDNIEILNPTADQIDVSLTPLLIWNEIPNHTYELEIATDNGFSNIIETVTGISSGKYQTQLLENSATYFWRVKGVSNCESTDYTTSGFTTVACNTFNSTDVPKSIASGAPNTITSTIEIAESGIVGDINVLNLASTHTYVEDLEVKLISPIGTQVILFSGICGSMDNFDLNFDQESTISAIDCPPTTGATYKPLESLKAFNGEDMMGTWTLSIADLEAGDGGSLQSWSLEICGENSDQKPNPPSNLKAEIINEVDIKLSWTDNSDNEREFSIEKSIGESNAFEQIGKTGTDITNFTDAGVSLDNNYYYRVVAIVNNDTSNYSNIVEVISVPLRPFNLVANEISSSTISLVWEDSNANKDSFTIERATETGSFEPLASIAGDQTSYIDDLVEPATIYNYRIKTVFEGKESVYSEILTTETLPLTPNVPRNLVLELISLEQINLAWVDDSDNEDGFVIERSIGDNSNYLLLDSLGSDIISYQDLTLGEPNVYFYRIKAYNTGGESPYSIEANESSLVLNTLNDINSKISFYPNPSSGIFQLKISNDISYKDVKLKVFDIIGNVVSPQLISIDNGTITIDITNQSDGIYFLRVPVDRKIITLKAIKSTN